MALEKMELQEQLELETAIASDRLARRQRSVRLMAMMGVNTLSMAGAAWAASVQLQMGHIGWATGAIAIFLVGLGVFGGCLFLLLKALL